MTTNSGLPYQREQKVSNEDDILLVCYWIRLGLRVGVFRAFPRVSAFGS